MSVQFGSHDDADAGYDDRCAFDLRLHPAYLLRHVLRRMHDHELCHGSLAAVAELCQHHDDYNDADNHNHESGMQHDSGSGMQSVLLGGQRDFVASVSVLFGEQLFLPGGTAAHQPQQLR